MRLQSGLKVEVELGLVGLEASLQVQVSGLALEVAAER